MGLNIYPFDAYGKMGSVTYITDSGNWTEWDGTVKNSNVVGDYVAADTDTTADTKYYGFTDIGGKWYIMRESSETYRFCRGSSGYTTAWSNRAVQSYDYFHNIF